MSRSGYGDYDCTEAECALWQGALKRATEGRRGQAFLREMLAALDAMPEKVLIADELRNGDGDVCAVGAVCAKRGIDTSGFDMEDEWVSEPLGEALGVARSLVAEIIYENDEGVLAETPADRYKRMRRWVERRIKP